jgi:hypothetical protein
MILKLKGLNNPGSLLFNPLSNISSINLHFLEQHIA